MKFLGNFTKSMKSYAKEKLEKLDKYVDISNAVITFKKFAKEENVKVEVSINNEIRASKIGADYYDLINDIVEKLCSQIRRYKSTEEFKSKSYGIADFLYEGEDPEYLDDISKEKILIPTEITSKEAIEDMELLGHDFYIYKDIDRGNDVCVIYKRYDETYGIIDIR